MSDFTQASTSAQNNGALPAAPTNSFRGLTKREVIAAQCMAASIAADPDGEYDAASHAQMAVRAADVLLLELQKEVSV